MQDPLLVEDTTAFKLPPSLHRILDFLGENATHHDYLVAVLIVLLIESRFEVVSLNESSEGTRKPDIYIPEDWKSIETGNYAIHFVLKDVPTKECKLVALPSGDVLIVNFFIIEDGSKIYSLAAQTLRYVNPYSSDKIGRYLNLKQLSHRFKDNLFSPVRTDIMQDAGMINPSFQGLPIELQLRILSLLDVEDLISMGQCSHQFYELSITSQLWKNLLRKDFRKKASKVGQDYRDWYRILYTELDEFPSENQQHNCAGANIHQYERPPWLFHRLNFTIDLSDRENRNNLY